MTTWMNWPAVHGTLLTRSGATVRALQRDLASSAPGDVAAAGVNLTTLAGLLHAHAAQPLHPEQHARPLALPAEHPWAEKLAARPQLLRLMARHVQRARMCRAAGWDLSSLRPELACLLDADFAPSTLLDAATRLLARAPATAVSGVGFAEGLRYGGSVGPMERALLAHLGASFDTPLCGDGPLTAMTVSDVAAEARQVVAAVSDCSEALVLVHDSGSEERIRAALRRNGVPVADDGASRLDRHALVALLRPMVSVFASRGAEPVHARNLIRLLAAPVLSQKPPKCGIVPVPDVAYPRANSRHIHEVLAGCARAQGTLRDWVNALQSIAQRAAEAFETVRASGAKEVWREANWLARVRVVEARVRTLANHAEAHGLLGDLAAAVRDLGLADPGGDVTGRAIMGALRDLRHLPCDEQAFADALSGAVASGRVDRGVQILRYAQYDGRPSELLVLTGVHDKGIARPPLRDPLLLDSDYTALDLPTPQEVVDERLTLARWAAARAGRSLAVVCENDETGRRVSPPLGLNLAFGARSSAHGFDLDLPELRDLDCLGAGGDASDALAMQVDLEWHRSGAGFAEREPSPGVQRTTTSLPEYLSAVEATVPIDLRPWLGEVGSAASPHGALPAHFSLSASRLTHFTQCLYRAFAQNVLRLRAPDEIAEDLNPLELGTAVHSILEHASAGVHWVVPDEAVDEAREALLSALQAHTLKAMNDTASERDATLEPAVLKSAREGLARRWQHHWPTYVASRILSVSEARKHLYAQLLPSLAHDPVFEAAAEAIGPGFAKTPAGKLRRCLEKVLVATGGEIDGLEDHIEDLAKSPASTKNLAVVQSNLSGPSYPPEVEALFAAARALVEPHEPADAGDLEVIRLEESFGRFSHDAKSTPLSLLLGREAVPVRGFIDVVARRDTTEGSSRTEVQIGDFKTNYSAPGTIDQITRSLVRPQLLLYALAKIADDSDETVTSVTYDWVRKATHITTHLDEPTLERARDTFGALLDRGRDGSWPLLPHPDGCPALGTRGAYCDFAAVCRLRSTFSPEKGV